MLNGEWCFLIPELSETNFRMRNRVPRVADWISPTAGEARFKVRR
jgi:hypothetical protein